MRKNAVINGFYSRNHDYLSVRCGLLVSFGLMSGQPVQLSASDMIFRQATVKGFWLAKIAQTLPAEKNEEADR